MTLWLEKLTRMQFDKTNSRFSFSGNLKQRVKELRQHQTEGEALLWEHLRNRKCRGFKFRRQHVIDRFIVDFCCPAAKLILEVDGGIHRAKKDEDAARDAALIENGYRILRIDNEAVLHATNSVLREIEIELEKSIGK